MNCGKILTPFNREDKSCYGAIYDNDGRIILESLRKSGCARIKHQDAVYFTGTSQESIEKNLMYLGHYFVSYGHFLLETLPMLDYIDRKWKGDYIFLAWGRVKRIDLLKNFLNLLDLGEFINKIIVHNNDKIIKSNFTVPDRPVEINKGFLCKDPYFNVVRKIKKSIKSQLNIGDKIFLCRDNSRVDSNYVNQVYSLCELVGFKFIYPEKLSLEDQVSVVSKAKIIAGFEGSNLHNSLFLDEGAKVLEFGSRRMSESGNPNQRWLCEMMNSNHRFIPHCDKEVRVKLMEFLEDF